MSSGGRREQAAAQIDAQLAPEALARWVGQTDVLRRPSREWPWDLLETAAELVGR